ncbi:MAG TPA: ThuA domain-containing protein [Chthoniobacteraceae bacterium]
MKRLAYFFVAMLLCCAALRADEPTKPLRALLICGGCCHDYEAQKKILSEGISARANVEFTIVHEGIPTANDDMRTHRLSLYEKPNWWAGYDVIIHDECFGFVGDNDFVAKIAAAHQAGVPAVMLHCSSHSYRAATSDEWRKIVGITSHSHETKRDLDVETINPTHPIMKGFPATWHDPGDELYKNEKVWPNAIPLAQAYGVDTKRNHVCIWANTYGNVRVFTTTLGHSNETVSSDVYLDLVTRGLLWTCNKLKDDGTSAKGYGPAGK